MLTLRLAYKNLVNAGTRTWLNVLVTSMSFVFIIMLNGFYTGMLERTKEIVIDTEVAGGVYWHPAYDPDDPFTVDDSHGLVPEPIQAQVDAGKAMPTLMVQGAMYPDGRMITAMLRGVPPDQQVVNIPTAALNDYSGTAIPTLLGSGMTDLTGLAVGDYYTLRWQDALGSYDAQEAEVVATMRVENYKIDLGQVWLPLKRLQEMSALPNEATFVTISQSETLLENSGTWVPHDVNYMVQDMIELVKSKRAGAAIMYVLLLALAALGIFNSQVLAIFQRRREIGSLMALGMARSRVVALFTTEGAMHSLLAFVVGAIWGGPLIYLLATQGVPLPYEAEDIGFVIGNRLVPVYGPSLIIGTTILVAIIVTVVSYLPSRRIAKMNPTEALRGRLG